MKSWSIAWVIGVSLAAPASAREAPPPDEDGAGSAREAEIFGGQSAREEELFGGESTREDELFGAEPAEAAPQGGAEARLAAELQSRTDFLDIGGQLFLRLEYFTFDEGDLDDFPLSAPALLDLYADARPNDRIRMYARGRVSHIATFEAPSAGEITAQLPTLGGGTFQRQAEPTAVLLDQLWLKLDVARTVFVTAGRQQVRWGSGRFWNPTDFLNVRNRDPLAIFDERLGVGLLRLHLPVESLGWNFYGVAVLEGANEPGEVGGAARGEFLFGTNELALSAAVRPGDPPTVQLGADLSSGIGLFDVHVEAAVQHGVRRPFFSGACAPQDLAPEELRDLLPLGRLEEDDRRDDWIPQVSAGAETSLNYSEEDSVLLGAEYFYNGAGYADDSLYPCLFARGAFFPLYTGEHYAGAYVVLPAPGSWNLSSFSLNVLGNLSDGSYLTRLDYAYVLHTYLRLNVYAGYHFGESGELHFRRRNLRIPSATGETTISIPGPVLDLGVALTLGF